ncbi:MAG TPA: hypothetical protein PKM25_07875 [Candidatus Ozemobacteraceae bacterium]|nr:hypothetical protein [Candidatus Ozemobacteraceae bacterium]
MTGRRWLLLTLLLAAIGAGGITIWPGSPFQPRPAVAVRGWLRTGTERSFDAGALFRLPRVTVRLPDGQDAAGGSLLRSFDGVRLDDLMREVQPATVPRQIVVVGGDGYRARISSTDLETAPAYLCFAVDGQPIPDDKGPFRIMFDNASAPADLRARQQYQSVWNVRELFGGEARPDQRRVLKLLTSVPDFIVEQLRLEFEEMHPEVLLTVMNPRAAEMHELVERLVATPDQPVPADVLWFSEPSDAVRMKMAGRLLAYHPRATESIPATLRDPDGCFTAVRTMRFGLVIPSTMRLPEPLEGLFSPPFGGHLGWVDSRHLGTYLIAAISGDQDLGWEFLRRYREQTASDALFQTFGELTEAVASRRVLAGFTLDYLVNSFRRARPKADVQFVSLPGLDICLSSPIAIASGTALAGDAESLVDVSLSPSLQARWTAMGMTSAIASDTSPAALTPVDCGYVALHADSLWKGFEETSDQVSHP